MNKIFGVWMWPKSIREHGADKTVERCALMGVTDIYFLAKGLDGVASFHSAYAPHVTDRDLLGELLDAAHRRGIRVHAWFTSASDHQYWQKHPESGRCHYIRGKDQGLISLADEGYLSYLAQVVEHLCRSYDVDGLHLDYIRYNHIIYGWSEEDKRRYAAEGADIDRLTALMDAMFVHEDKQPEAMFDAFRAGDPSVLALTRARRKDVLHFAQTMVNTARAVKPGLTLSAALMPEGAYDDVAFSDVHYGQNYQDAAGLYDYALPMAYSQAYGKDAAWVRGVAEGTMRRGMKTIVGLHAYEGGTAETLRADISGLADTPVEGVCLFREGAFVQAHSCGREVTLFNPLDKHVRIAAGGTFLLDALDPHCEAHVILPAEPAALAAFAGDNEIALYHHKA